ncbi:hypothetical protein TorRG33x02_345970 [Trema orientale]|uniref:Uncharacterized protein n=1 Tax=Trema orientale TaxID=63057 RepID=A0A2P5ANA3_TREOI|nr:hypothetical protein TorRG33x02_345970 [Trema orientale]
MSERNATNRVRQLLVSKYGAASIAHKQYKKRNLTTGEFQPIAESFRDRYVTERTRWPSAQIRCLRFITLSLKHLSNLVRAHPLLSLILILRMRFSVHVADLGEVSDPAIYDDSLATRGGYSEDDRLTTAINRGSSGAEAHKQRILSSLVPDVNMSTSALIHLGSTSTSFTTMPPPPPLPRHFAHPPPTHQEDDSEETDDEDLGL